VTDNQAEQNDRTHALREALRAVRRRYDALERGKTAQIRRSRTADDIALEGSYWRIGETLAHTQRRLPHVVLLFPFAPQVKNARERFSFGRYLRTHIGDSEGATLRFRRLIDSRDPDDLDHRLRGILRLAASDHAPVDWGVLGTDILWFFAESDSVRRRWAQDFYAPLSRETNSPVPPSSHASTPTEERS
jgi:CRISPR type I-E-associated protein CasB/Cse2